MHLPHRGVVRIKWDGMWKHFEIVMCDINVRFMETSLTYSFISLVFNKKREKFRISWLKKSSSWYLEHCLLFYQYLLSVLSSCFNNYWKLKHLLRLYNSWAAAWFLGRLFPVCKKISLADSGQRKICSSNVENFSVFILYYHSEKW